MVYFCHTKFKAVKGTMEFVIRKERSGYHRTDSVDRQRGNRNITENHNR